MLSLSSVTLGKTFNLSGPKFPLCIIEVDLLFFSRAMH